MVSVAGLGACVSVAIIPALHFSVRARAEAGVYLERSFMPVVRPGRAP